MLSFAVRRLFASIPVLFGVSVITFLLMHAVPGGPFDREKVLPEHIIANLEEKYNLDQPLWRQYTDYMEGVVLHFDFGPSYSSRTRTVNDIFRDHLPVSLQLGALALVMAIVIGAPLGILAAYRQNTWLDYSSMFVAVLGLSIPNLALGPFLMWLFGLKLDLLPVATWGEPQHYVLPVITLGTGYAAFVARLTRASVLQVIREDFVRTARAKGLAERVVLTRHVLRNALVPVVTYLGPLTAILLTGTVVVEEVFAVPGLGRFFVSSISNRDYPVIMGITLLFALVVIVANLIVDIAYGLLDPRVRTAR